MVDFIKSLNQFVIEISALMGALTLLLGTIATLVMQSKKDKKLESFITDYDKRQTDRIDKHDVILEKLQSDISGIQCNISNIESKIDKIDKHVEDDAFKRKLKSKISVTVNSFLEVNSDLESPIQSIIIEGGHHAYVYFRDIREIGYESINLDQVKRNAVQVFRSLRSGFGGERNITPEFTKEVKRRIIPLIDKLVTDLLVFKSGLYNGTSDAKFLDLAAWFVDRVLTELILTYRLSNK